MQTQDPRRFSAQLTELQLELLCFQLPLLFLSDRLSTVCHGSACRQLCRLVLHIGLFLDGSRFALTDLHR